jgi:hypothetical protein
MATSDDARDDAPVSKLNASINGWKGVTLTLFAAMRMIGVAFECSHEVDAALDAAEPAAALEAATPTAANTRNVRDADAAEEEEDARGGRGRARDAPTPATTTPAPEDKAGPGGHGAHGKQDLGSDLGSDDEEEQSGGSDSDAAYDDDSDGEGALPEVRSPSP